MFSFLSFFSFFYLPGSQGHPDSAPEVGEDAVTSVGAASSTTPDLTEEERQELQEELVKVRRGQRFNRRDVGLSEVNIHTPSLG